MTSTPFDSVLVANRGEIACRIIRTLRAMGIRSIAVYSDADEHAMHVSLADEAVRIGPARAADSYLSIPAVLEAARSRGAQAIHPGYGFLSENAEFARACAAAGVVFVGPTPEAIDAMGDKLRAKAHVAQHGVPVIPGAGEAGMSDAELAIAAESVGYPLIIKPSAGGGGKGMTVVESPDGLVDAIASARRIATSAFGDDTLLLERYLATPRHIEVQVLADSHGTTIHLGERECSLQRRHQKVIEEAPSPLLDATTRARMGEAACAVARSVGYTGAGTIEFLVSGERPDEFFFMETNTRLQVEHPVTELVTGIDLVEWQLRIAAGEPLTIAQGDVHLTGHAIEARVYAEDAEADFLPSAGDIGSARWPEGDGIRVDAGVTTGSTVTTDYDPMLAKVIAWGDDRATALNRLDDALARTSVLGVATNLRFLRRILADGAVRSGDLDTGLLARIQERPAVPARRTADAPSPWSTVAGWRLGEHRTPTVADRDAELAEHLAGLVRAGVRADPEVRATMPGTVSAISVEPGAPVGQGQPLVTVEAMKMEHAMVAGIAGTVQLHVALGDQVRQGQLVATITPGQDPHEGTAASDPHEGAP